MHTIVYGLHVRSDIPLPWCVPAPESPPDLRIFPEPADPDPAWQNAPVWYVSPFFDESGVPGAVIRRSPDGRFRLTYVDGPAFVIDAQGREIHAGWDDPAQEGSALAYLLGPVLGWVLRLRGISCLHASALAVRGKALLLVGWEGAGKSTTAAALLRAGHAVLTDDVAPLREREDGLWVSPGMPRLLLGAASAKALWGERAEVSPLFPGSDKSYVDGSAPFFRFCGQAIPLGAVYFLERRDPSLREPHFAAVTGAAGLTRLAANTFANRVPDEAMVRADFALLGRLINRYPVRSVTAPDDLGGLEQLCDDLIADFRDAAL